ncbi:MAG: DUF4450 domain-containing protein [Bacteroidales bacterium]|nr:DUF4450 domain-containing protein [Bacteroidales bacterium]
MSHKRILLSAVLLFTALCAASAAAPETRVMRYYPDGRDFVCLNADGRFTRPLYGTNTRFRLETSDRPVFAAFDRAESWNFRFWLDCGGTSVQLDETSWCEARYQGGRRSYTVRDDCWGKGELRITVLASFFGEGAIWQFRATGFDTPPTLTVKRCRIAGTKFSRDGDMGVDPRELFEPAEGEPDLTVLSWAATVESYLLYEDNDRLSLPDAAVGAARFEKEEAARQELMGQVEINTPDPFFNTLGSSLMAAADGIWDGQTFLHGANGWRTPYCGWRGGYTGDVVGWNDRAVSHFRTYSKSMVTDIPPVLPQPQQDTLNNLCRALKEWGTPMYSNGYICRLPGRTDQMSHYDMNLNYIDELMWHFCYDADPEFLREMWPYIVLHHQWEKRNFDADNDHLYDAYCCIWASDALYYNGGAVTHSSAYNYRSNLLTARIAEIIGEDPTPYREEARAILEAMNGRLWMDDLGYWAEFQDFMGLKRLHKSAAIWTIYTPIDCEACTPEQAWQATEYVDRSIPRIPVRYAYDEQAVRELGLSLPAPETDLYTISTSDWMPYVWSTNNVAHEEVANMALAYLQAGRSDVGFRLLKADLLDEMYLGGCPGNFGQISYYDKAKNEAYRDFADNVGISSRAIVCGLFGIIPDALNGRCVLQPAFPDEWDEASIKTPYLSFRFHREGDRDIYEVEQNFTRPLQILVRTNAGGGAFLETSGDASQKQTIVVDRSEMPRAIRHKKIRAAKADVGSRRYLKRMGLGEINPRMRKARLVDLTPYFNSNVDDIYRNEYLSPRPPFTTLELPKQGVGEWCIPHEMHEIQDDGFRSTLQEGVFDTGLGVRFRSPEQGPNILYTSLWDNYPDSITVPLEGRARWAYLLMAGSTNNMQSRIENGRVTVTYTDGSTDVMPLENPINWCPIEQDYYVDGYAFWTAPLKPYRVLLSDGRVSRDISLDFLPAAENDNLYDAVKETDRGIPDGAAQILKMPLRRGRKLQSLKLETLSNDVVIGLMAITLEM